ncbi:MAG TPA: cupin domain-containing protein [Gaiellaceae bacterium]|jgi:quercetin dioxygenase-like cupin family protein
MDPVVTFPGEGERFERENRTITILVDRPGLSIFEMAFDETFVVDPHTHDDHDDAFLVLEGEVEFTVGDDTLRAGPGTVLSAPPGVRHGFRSAGGHARVLNFHAPDAGFAAFIRSPQAAS